MVQRSPARSNFTRDWMKRKSKLPRNFYLVSFIFFENLARLKRTLFLQNAHPRLDEPCMSITESCTILCRTLRNYWRSGYQIFLLGNLACLRNSYESANDVSQLWKMYAVYSDHWITFLAPSFNSKHSKLLLDWTEEREGQQYAVLKTLEAKHEEGYYWLIHYKLQYELTLYTVLY